MEIDWLKAIENAELFSLCPELKQIDQSQPFSPDDMIQMVREVKATKYYQRELPRNMYPTPDPHEFNKLRQSYGRLTKDYNQQEVVQLDNTKRKYWASVKHEIELLICTKDKKYTELRKKLSVAVKHSEVSAVAMISATLASILGVAVGVISGLVAVVLFAIVKIGTNAYCAAVFNSQA